MPKMYCCEAVEHIQGYAQAATSPELFDCHHRFEEMGLTHKDLKEMGLYYKRPACELIFIPFREHRRLHNNIIPTTTQIEGRYQKGQVPIFTEAHRRHISEAKKGVRQSPEHTAHVVEAQRATRISAAYRKGAQQRMTERFADPECRQQQSTHVSELWKNDSYRQAQCAAVGKAIQADAEAYKAYKAAGSSLSWKAWRSEFSPYRLYQAQGGARSRATWIRHGRPAHD